MSADAFSVSSSTRMPPVESQIIYRVGGGGPCMRELLHYFLGRIVRSAAEGFGERINAVLSLEQGEAVTPETLADHVRSQLAGYKVPRKFLIVDKVRRAPNGKPDYVWARNMAKAAAQDEPAR